jgi:hypothetical protein
MSSEARPRPRSTRTTFDCVTHLKVFQWEVNDDRIWSGGALRSTPSSCRFAIASLQTQRRFWAGSKKMGLSGNMTGRFSIFDLRLPIFPDDSSQMLGQSKIKI